MQSITFEQHRLRAFGNRVLSRISGPKRETVMGGWIIRRSILRTLHKNYYCDKKKIKNKK
jgi:hypothetical protein